MLIRLTAYVLLLGLVACQPPVISDAPAVTKYTAQEQNDMADAYDRLPGDSPLCKALKGCRALRGEVRASR